MSFSFNSAMRLNCKSDEISSGKTLLGPKYRAFVFGAAICSREWLLCFIFFYFLLWKKKTLFFPPSTQVLCPIFSQLVMWPQYVTSVDVSKFFQWRFCKILLNLFVRKKTPKTNILVFSNLEWFFQKFPWPVLSCDTKVLHNFRGHGKNINL